MKKYSFPIIILLVLLGIGFWIYSASLKTASLVYKEVTKPLSGEAVAQLSRDHVTDISKVQYNSNPPTSGPHFSAWAKPGRYDVQVSDGYLVHSLEHGYIVLSYDCEKKISNFQFSIFNVYAAEPTATPTATDKNGLEAGNLTKQTASDPITPETAPKDAPVLPDSFASDSCKKLADQLSEYLKVAKRVIVVPRPGMDTPIALTAWGRIEKLNGIDDGKIRGFISAWENKGPEATME